MLKEEIVKWIGKTFGKPKHRDRFEMSCKISEISKQGAKVRIEELNFVFQRMKGDVGEKEIKKWKQELDEITGNSLRVFHVGNEVLHGIASAEDIKGGAREGELVTGKAMMINVQIFKETFIANEILFPSRRH